MQTFQGPLKIDYMDPLAQRMNIWLHFRMPTRFAVSEVDTSLEHFFKCDFTHRLLFLFSSTRRILRVFWSRYCGPGTRPKTKGMWDINALKPHFTGHFRQAKMQKSSYH